MCFQWLTGPVHVSAWLDMTCVGLNACCSFKHQACYLTKQVSSTRVIQTIVQATWFVGCYATRLLDESSTTFWVWHGRLRRQSLFFYLAQLLFNVMKFSLDASPIITGLRIWKSTNSSHEDLSGLPLRMPRSSSTDVRTKNTTR